MTDLTHFDESGASRMVDVGGKPITERLAVAEATIHMQPETLALIRDGGLAKGDVFEVARLAATSSSSVRRFPPSKSTPSCATTWNLYAVRALSWTATHH